MSDTEKTLAEKFKIPRKEYSVFDCEGREIKLRKPNYMEQRGFMGSFQNLNQGEMIYDQMLQYVFMIDKEIVPVPSTQLERDWLGQKLDEAEDGIEVLRDAVNLHFLTAKPKGVDTALKNS